MQNFVGVTNFLLVNQGLKRPALIFDRIAILHLNSAIEYFARHERSRGLAADLEWLQEAGVVFEPKEVQSLPAWPDVPVVKPLQEVFVHLAGLSDRNRGQVKTSDEVLPKLLGMDVLSRLYSVVLSLSEGTDAVPLCLYPDVSQLGLDRMGIAIRRQQVIHVVLEALPVPDETTSWERVIDFRSDPDSRAKFQGIRNWISDVARTDLAPAELRDKLEWSVREYGDHLKLHKMKTNVGFLETVVTTGAELVEDVLKLKMAKAAKLLFSAKLRTISVLEAEATAPGRELGLRTLGEGQVQEWPMKTFQY